MQNEIWLVCCNTHHYDSAAASASLSVCKCVIVATQLIMQAIEPVPI